MGDKLSSPWLMIKVVWIKTQKVFRYKELHKPIVSHSSHENLTCSTFSRAAKELVCGMETQ